MRPHFFAAALGYEHAVGAPTRFNPGRAAPEPFAVLYFTESPLAGLLEVSALLETDRAGAAVGNPQSGAWTVFPVEVRLSRVIDLCDPEQVRLLGTSIQELTGNWRGYADRAGPGQPDVAPTQRFGNALFRRGRAEALLTYSARHPTTRNLVVFPARLRAGSAITLFNPATRAPLQRLGPGGALETF